MTKLSTFAVLASLSLLPSTAFAVELDLTNITDFVKYQSSYVTTAEGVTVTFTALNYGDTKYNVDLTYQKGDGLGVDTTTDSNVTSSTGSDMKPNGDVLATSDEINAAESIRVTFSEDVVIESIAITDIYDKYRETRWFVWPTETGAWRVTDSAGTLLGSGAFAGNDERTGYNNGEIDVNVGELARILTVWSTNSGSEAAYKGFSLAGITYTTVPVVDVPELSGQGMSAAAFLLLGAAQMIGARRRRFVGA